MYRQRYMDAVKMTLGQQPALGGHSRDTRRALAFHLGHLRVTCISLQLHLLFTCSSLIHTSFTYGSLGQQSVQWMLHNWLISARRPAFTKHSLTLWCPEKALPGTSFGPIDFISMPLLSLHWPFSDTPWSFSFSEAHCVTNDWTKEAHTHALVSHLVTCFSCLFKWSIY